MSALRLHVCRLIAGGTRTIGEIELLPGVQEHDFRAAIGCEVGASLLNFGNAAQVVQRIKSSSEGILPCERQHMAGPEIPDVFRALGEEGGLLCACSVDLLLPR